jgi:hypothetical protein
VTQAHDRLARWVLDAAAQQWLEPEHRPAPAVSDITVLLSETESGHIAVQAGNHRVGVLSDPDAARFRSAMAQGRREHRPVVTVAARVRTDDGSWRLSIYFPSDSG